METVKAIRIVNPAILSLVGRIQSRTGEKTASAVAENLIFAGAQASGEAITVPIDKSASDTATDATASGVTRPGSES